MDHIDLYQVHATDVATPTEEALRRQKQGGNDGRLIRDVTCNMISKALEKIRSVCRFAESMIARAERSDGPALRSPLLPAGAR